MEQSHLVKYEDYFELTAANFRSLGLNPYFECKGKTSMSRKWLNFLHFHICFWTLLITTSLELFFCCTIVGREGQLLDFCRSFSCTLFDIMGIEEMILMWSGNKFNEFILNLEQMFPIDRETQEKYKIAQHHQATIKILKMLTNLFFLCIFIWVVGSPTYDIVLCYIQNTRYVLDLPFQMWFPWDMDHPVAFYFALFMQLETIYASVMIILALNTLMISIMSQITLQFDMLAQNIKELQPNDLQGIIKITLMHIRLIEVSQQFARLISRTVFLNHILSSMGCSIGLFQVVITEDMGEKFRFIVYLLCVLLQTFNMSFIGDLLIEHVSVFISCEITLNFSHLEFESCPSSL